MTSYQLADINSTISDSLNRAEKNWNAVKTAFAMESLQERFEHYEPSKIPGHPFVSDGKPEVTTFIAMVVDMRNSTDHLKTVVNNPKIKNGFQRIYYETSALLPAISKTVSFENGFVTEYLGDGALILFKVDDDDNEKEIITSVSVAAKNCIYETRQAINLQLQKRYNLKAIDIGIGLSIGKAMVTLVGDTGNPQPKAIGECIWEATKLSCETNKIGISNSLYGAWPSSKGGTVKFKQFKFKRGVSGYIMG